MWIMVLLIHDADMFEGKGYDSIGWVLLFITISVVFLITGLNFKKLREEVWNHGPAAYLIALKF